MPGHVKLGNPGEPDPDPKPYLVVSMDMKREDMLRAYDPKKSYWCPDDKGGYAECMLESDDGNKAVVMAGHIVSEFMFHVFNKLPADFLSSTPRYQLNLFFYSFIFRKKSLRPMKLDRLIHRNSRSVKTWQILLILMMLRCFIIWKQDLRQN